ncbi:MAG: ATP-binding cassette domain-containing protein, partial [Pseudomonadota bacterium]|nr:ATP-binding cassette domain-containing protein [Pseudomonadota bacterium]
TRLRDTVNTTIINIVRNLLTVVALTIFMYLMNVQMALIYTMIVIPLGVVFMRRLGRVTRKASRQGLEEIGGLSKLISETLGGLRIVKAYGQEADQITRAGSTIDTLLNYTMRSVRARAAASPAIEMLAGIAIGVIIFYGGYQSTQGNLTAGEFMGFISALLMAYQPLRAVANLQTILQEGVSAGERIFTVLDASDEIIDMTDAPSLDIQHGAISFENVTFGYAGRDTPALDGISLDVPAGQTVALVGASGSGKSTLLNLTLRFFDIDTGNITIDRQNIRDVSLDSLRAATALVTQEPFLFDDTIAKNIAFGKVDATRADIEQAARNAAAHEFICALPQGYETHVGEGGIRLSGGQKQRLAIARAILKDAPILLLDEATSALDTVSEAQVQKALEKLLEGRTALIIAHRLSTVMHADRIYVLEKGRLRETGTHGDLLAADGLYAELYRTQFQESQD